MSRKITVIVLKCNQCDFIFEKRNKNHYKCPRCGAAFTKPTKEKVKG